MGLRLYQAPVESDIPPRGVDNKPSTSPQARSSIRRTRLRPDQSRTERRRLALIESTLFDGWERRRQSSGAQQYMFRPPDVATGSADTRRGAHDQVATLSDDRWTRFHSESTLDTVPVGIQTATAPSIAQSENSTANTTLRRRLLIPTTYSTSDMIRSRRPMLSPPSLSRSPRAFGPTPRSGSPSALEDPMVHESSVHYNGLGDRNRSMSPESDNVWDTLLSTLTSDLQPPSIGPPFGSASATQTVSTSSGTSFTSPEEAARDATVEPLCESGLENSETEGDGDNEIERNRLTRFPSSLRAGQRSSAQVARGNGDDQSLELLGGLDGLQRILRRYVQREDIPDEWWAAAGLRRTLSRETSIN